MNRRTFLATLAAGLLAAPVAQATRGGRVWRIAYRVQGPAARSKAYLDGLTEGLRELGWVEGRNIAVEVRFAEGRPTSCRDSQLNSSASKWISSSHRPPQ